MPLLIAHRGASAEEPENSLAAFRRAIDLGADGIELDVHASADGVIVVHHDPVVDGHAIHRTAHGVLRAHTLANGEPVPTLPDALAAIGTDCTVFVEVKGLAPEHDEAFLQVLDGAPRPAHCHVHSFDHRVVQRLKRRRPALVTGVLSTSYPVRPIAQLTDSDASELWQERSLLDAPLVHAVHEAGARVYVWTVDDPAEARRMRALGVDGLCTNRPDAVREILR